MTITRLESLLASPPLTIIYRDHAEAITYRRVKEWTEASARKYNAKNPRNYKREAFNQLQVECLTSKGARNIRPKAILAYRQENKWRVNTNATRPITNEQLSMLLEIKTA